MNILYIIAGFISVPLTIAVAFAIATAVKKGKIKLKPILKSIGALLLVVTIGTGSWYGYQYLTRTTPAKVGPSRKLPLQKWQLCWEKKPGFRGDSPLRRLCLPAKIKRKDKNYIVVSYGSSRTNGVIEVAAGGGKVYTGTWKDAGGWGKISLYFTSSRTATGWLDEEGQRNKDYSFVLERL